MKFKVGDRVRVYGHAEFAINPVIGMVESEGKTLRVLLENDRRIFAHPKQCRRLVKKERRRVWVGRGTLLQGPNSEQFHFMEARFLQPWPNEKTSDGKPWLEFVEVKRK